MKKLCGAALLGLVLAMPPVVRPQEVINPPPVGGGTSYTRTVNGQIVEVTTIGSAQVEFHEITAARVRGTITKVDPSEPSCQATIRWVNRGLQQTHTLANAAPPLPFIMESGDVDKRNGGSEND